MFDKEQYVDGDNRNRVRCWGPIGWGPLDEEPVGTSFSFGIKLVQSVEQGEAIGGDGVSEWATRESELEPAKWWCDVEVSLGDAFTVGPAVGAGTAIVMPPGASLPKRHAWLAPTELELKDRES